MENLELECGPAQPNLLYDSNDDDIQGILYMIVMMMISQVSYIQLEYQEGGADCRLRREKHRELYRDNNRGEQFARPSSST